MPCADMPHVEDALYIRVHWVSFFVPCLIDPSPAPFINNHLAVLYRVWDSVLFDGDEMLFRVGLAIFTMLEPGLMASTDMIGVCRSLAFLNRPFPEITFGEMYGSFNKENTLKLSSELDCSLQACTILFFECRRIVVKVYRQYPYFGKR